MTRIEATRVFDAPADVVWAVITDSDVYAEVAPNLSSIVILDGEGEGMVRECVDTNGNAWTESCHYWEAGRGFAVAVDVDTSEFHRPFFSRFEGRWELSEGSEGVLVTVQFDFEPRYGPLGALLSRYFQYKAGPLIEAIFDGWCAEIDSRIEKAAPSYGSGESPGPGTHTDQLYCRMSTTASRTNTRGDGK
jgi:ribosome-associated toxin RatA of RatAB toxin-antitoxin module